MLLRPARDRSSSDLRLSFTSHAPDALTCEVQGELDLAAGEIVAAALMAAASDERPLTIVLDHVTFVDAAGLRMLEDVASVRRSAGRPLRIIGASPLTLRLLREVGLDDGVDLRGRAPADGREQGRGAADGHREDDRRVMALAQLSSALGALMPGAVGASVSIRRNRRYETIASTDVRAGDLDAVQYEHEQGPCVDALGSGRQVVGSADVLPGRWPLFAPHAERRGVASVVSTPLGGFPDVAAAINVYSGEDAVGERTLYALQQLAEGFGRVTRTA